MANFTRFTTFPIFCHQSISFLEKFQKFLFQEGYIGKFFEFFKFFLNRFKLKQLKLTHNGKFFQKSGLDWLKTANFACFPIFSPKMRFRLTWNGQFHLIHKFSHLVPPKCLIFGKISKIFILKGGH